MKAVLALTAWGFFVLCGGAPLPSGEDEANARPGSAEGRAEGAAGFGLEEAGAGARPDPGLKYV